MNGASEATLSELLAVAQAQNVNLIKMIQALKAQTDEIKKGGGGSTGSSASSAAAGLASVAKVATPLGVAMNAILGAGDLVAKLFSGLGGLLGSTLGVISNVGGELVAFAVKAAEGTAKLSDLYAAFKDLPFGIGMVANVFANIVAYSEKLIETYQKLTNVGASFGGDLLVMRAAAAKAQMTLAEFGKVVSENADVFAGMGSTVQDGIGRFVDIQSTLMGPNSKYARSLLNLGYTSEDAANMLTGYIRSQGSITKASLQSNDQISASIVNVAKEVDLYAKATGINRETLEKEMKKASFDAAWKTFTAGMDPEKRKQAEADAAMALAQFGEGARDMIRTSYMTNGEILTPLTDAAKNFLAVNGDAGELYIKNLRNNTLSMKAGSEELLFSQMKNARDLAKAGQLSNDNLGELGGVLATLNPKVIGTAQQMETALKMAKMTDTELRALAVKTMKEQKEQNEGSAAALINAERNIKTFGNTITRVMASLLGPITNHLVDFGDVVTSVVNDFIKSDGFKNTIKNVTDWFKTAFTDLKAAYKEGGFEAAFKLMFERMTAGFGNIWAKVWPVIEPALTTVWKKMEPLIVKLFTSLFQLLTQAIKDYFNIGETTTDKEWKATTQSALTSKTDMGKAFQEYVANAREAEYAESQVPGNVSYTKSDVDLYEQFQKEFPSYFKKSENANAAQPKPKATGGPISPGAYLVGEKGPELINTSSSGDVITNENLTALFRNAANNNANQQSQQLNTLLAQLLQAQRENNDLSRRQLDATKGLSGNLFA